MWAIVSDLFFYFFREVVINVVKIYVERRKDNGTNLVVNSEIDGVSHSKRYDVEKLKVDMRQLVIRNLNHIDEEAQSLCIPGGGKIVFLRWFEMIKKKKCVRYEAFEDEFSGAGGHYRDESIGYMPNGIPYYSKIEKTLQDNVWLAESPRGYRKRLLKLSDYDPYGCNRRSIWFDKLISETKVASVTHYIVTVGSCGGININPCESYILDDSLRTLFITGISDSHEVESYPVCIDSYRLTDREFEQDRGLPLLVVDLKTFKTGLVLMTSQQCGRGYETPYTHHHDEDDIFHSSTTRHYMNYIRLRNLNKSILSIL